MKLGIAYLLLLLLFLPPQLSMIKFITIIFKLKFYNLKISVSLFRLSQNKNMRKLIKTQFIKIRVSKRNSNFISSIKYILIFLIVCKKQLFFTNAY